MVKTGASATLVRREPTVRVVRASRRVPPIQCHAREAIPEKIAYATVASNSPEVLQLEESVFFAATANFATQAHDTRARSPSRMLRLVHGYQITVV
jgi:hypothetical protein